MKEMLLAALFALPFSLLSQVTIFTENFDTYSDQDYAGVVSPFMSSWTGATGPGTPDCQVTSAEFNSPSNSVAIFGVNGGGAIDAMLVFPASYTSGRFELSFTYKVANSMGAYFNIQPNGSVPGTAWMVQVFFAADGTGLVKAGGQNFPFNYTNGSWSDVLIECDLDTDTGRIWIEGTELGSGFVWSLESNGFGTGGNKAFGGVNFYSASGDPVADCEYYVDDIVLIETTGVGLEEENLIPAMNIYPNPSNGNFTISYSDISKENVSLTLVDVLGNPVYSKNMNSGSVLGFPLQMELKNGIYFVKVANGSKELTKKIIVNK